MENERLQQRLADLRQRAPKVLSASASLLAATYGATTMRPPRSIPAPLAIPNQRASEITQPYYPMSATSAGGYAMLTSPISSTFDGPGVLPYASLYASHQVEDDLSEDGMRKKKVFFNLYVYTPLLRRRSCPDEESTQHWTTRLRNLWSNRFTWMAQGTLLFISQL